MKTSLHACRNNVDFFEFSIILQKTDLDISFLFLCEWWFSKNKAFLKICISVIKGREANFVHNIFNYYWNILLITHYFTTFKINMNCLMIRMSIIITSAFLTHTILYITFIFADLLGNVSSECVFFEDHSEGSVLTWLSVKFWSKMQSMNAQLNANYTFLNSYDVF